MKRRAPDWKFFWKYENVTHELITGLNMDIFIKSTMPIIKYNSEDVIMDIGSGDCQVASYLKEKVKEIHCLDISERNLKDGKKRFEQYKNIFFYLLDINNYTDLTIIKRNILFTKILCLSVIQYYDSKEDLEKLIIEVEKLAAPGAKLLIADIPSSELSSLDILFFLKIASKKKLILPAIIHLLKARLSSYHELNKKVGLTYYSVEDIENLIVKRNLNAKIIKNQLTINKRRIHLLVNF